MVEITKGSLDMIIEVIESYLMTSDHLEPEINLYEYLKGLQADYNRIRKSPKKMRNNQGEK